MSGLWIDKYRPLSFSKLDFHYKISSCMQRIGKSTNFPHLFIYGPSGSGKRTRIMCLLRELYGSVVEKLRLQRETFETPSGKRLEISLVTSNYHLEVNPSDAGIYDRVVVQQLIKTTAQTNQFDANSQRGFKVVVITEVDTLTRDAQHALRRTMEKYASTCRLILVGSSASHVIGAIRSRCQEIRIPAPNTFEVCQVLRTIANKEGMNNVSDDTLTDIVVASERNVRRAILKLEAMKVSKRFNVIPEADWELYLRTTARMMVSEQSAQQLMSIRSRIYELLGHCIPPDVILVGLLNEICTSCDRQLQGQVVQSAAHYDSQLRQGSKPIFHLEAFVANFMHMYDKFTTSGLVLDDAMF